MIVLNELLYYEYCEHNAAIDSFAAAMHSSILPVLLSVRWRAQKLAKGPKLSELLRQGM